VTTGSNILRFDAVIVGGGVAGLWLLNRLCATGYNAILFEQEALGAGQSIASQGMIHGGVKYTLSGALSGASEAIADMPDYWRRCLAGKGDVNLAQTQTLSDHFYMWSTDSTISKAAGFLASKTLRGRVDALAKEQHPPLFAHPSFKGKLYQLVDSVIDTGSLLNNLANNHHERIFRIHWQQARFVRKDTSITLHLKDDTTQEKVIEAGQFIFSAGKGNGTLLESINAAKPEMQLRSLQQVMVKHRHDYFLYAHCIGADSTPRLTISSHRCIDGAVCWYLGGQLAEKGVNKMPAQLIQEAKTELCALFPWLNWQTAQWTTLAIDRAEARQKNFVRPDNAFMDRAYPTDDNAPFDNVLVAWPTKLTLSPHLGEEALRWLKQLGTIPGQYSSDPESLLLPAPSVAPAPWDIAEWQT
jgi:glycerol-3-phosphate dehydrogenase